MAAQTCFLPRHYLTSLLPEWHPVDDQPSITTTLRGLPYANALPYVLLTRPPWYPDRDHRPAVTKLLIEHRVPRPHILSVSLRWKTGNLSAANCSATSRYREASWIQGCRRACKRSKFQCDVTNSYCKLFWKLYCRHRLFPLCDYIVQ